MRVLLVNKFWYRRGGAEAVATFTKELLEKAGHTVEVFGMKHPQNIFSNDWFADFVDYDRVEGWEKVKAGFKSIYNSAAKKKFAALMGRFKPDVIHFHNIYHQLSFSLLEAAKEAGVKMVMTLHDFQLLSPSYNLYHHGRVAEECLGGHYYRCLFNNCLEDWPASAAAVLGAYFSEGKGYKKMIDRYLCPSHFLLNKFLADGFEQNKMAHLPNPVAVSGEAEGSEEGGYVGYFGRLSPEKGVGLLLDAAKLTPTVKYLIVGTGPAKTNMEERIRAENIGNATLEGYREGEALKKLIKGATIVCSPSVCYENSPMTILEAKALGKVVVGSDRGGIPELLLPELLFKGGDAKALAEKVSFWHGATPEKRREIGERLRESALRENSPEKYLEKLVKEYQG